MPNKPDEVSTRVEDVVVYFKAGDRRVLSNIDCSVFWGQGYPLELAGEPAFAHCATSGLATGPQMGKIRADVLPRG